MNWIYLRGLCVCCSNKNRNKSKYLETNDKKKKKSTKATTTEEEKKRIDSEKLCRSTGKTIRLIHHLSRPVPQLEGGKERENKRKGKRIDKQILIRADCCYSSKRKQVSSSSATNYAICFFPYISSSLFYSQRWIPYAILFWFISQVSTRTRKYRQCLLTGSVRSCTVYQQSTFRCEPNSRRSKVVFSWLWVRSIPLTIDRSSRWGMPGQVH